MFHFLLWNCVPVEGQVISAEERVISLFKKSRMKGISIFKKPEVRDRGMREEGS